MVKTCFVIMPFSDTKTCTKIEWTQIFHKVFKPAIIDANEEYIVKRAEIKRGAIIRDIVQDLKNSDLVLADLTDHNPNVFYELGVRHALNNRTILVAQRIEDIPSDLKAYSVIIYGRTPQDIKLFKKKMKILLKDIEENPNRADNPVSDYLDENNDGLTDKMSREDRIFNIEVHVGGCCIRKRKGSKEYEVLIGLRSPDRLLYPNYWAGGGGQVHSFETFEDAVIRQLKEEFGIMVEPITVIGTYHIKDKKHKKIIPGLKYVCKYRRTLSGQVKLSKEFIDYKWVTKDELYKYNMIPGSRGDFEEAISIFENRRYSGK